MTPSLNRKHLQNLTQGSGLLETNMQRRGWRTDTDPAALLALGFSKSQARLVPTLTIPLWNVHGQQTGWMIRPDSPRMIKGRVAKYEPPKGAHNILDIHPSVQPLLDDPHVPLWLTEGVKKGDALADRGACAIDFPGGVWGFRGTNAYGGKVILPDWQHVPLNGRLVTIVYDSDLVTNAQVHQALEALITFLRYRHARPACVHWPEDYQQTKWGVDDFLVAGHSLEERKLRH
jgi:hypothetical protein